MKRKTVKRLAACLLFAGALLLTGCGGKKDALSAIRESGTLRIALVETGDPFARVVDGQPEGIEPDLAGQTAEALGVTVSYTVMDREEALDAVASGEADLAMGGLTENSGTSRGLLASVSYGKRFLYFVTKDGVYVNSSSELNDQTIGICSGMSPETVEVLTLSGNMETLRFEDVSAAEESLKNGEIMGYFCYRQEAEEFMRKDGVLVQNLPFLVWEEYCAQASPDNTALISGLNVLIQRQLEAADNTETEGE